MILAGALQGVQSSNGGNQLYASITWLIYLALLIWAILLAVNCNKGKSAFLPILGAIFFPEIYLIQYGVRKYLINETGYCPAVGRSKFQGL